MREKKGKPVYARLTLTNQERFEFALKCRLSPSEIINGVMDRYFHAWIKEELARRAKTLREALNAPVP
jgi:hypothetical protein